MEGSINLRIKTLDGREHVIELSRDSSICDLKNKIERNIGVARDLQRIIFQGRCLTDDLTVATAGIENNSVVHLVERAPPPTSGAPTGNENTGSENTGNRNSTPQPEVNEGGRRSSNSRNRIRSQLERHTQQFINAINEINTDSQTGSANNQTGNGHNETDMESFARQLSSIATGIEILPEYLRYDSL